MEIPKIDWFASDKYPQDTCHCKCGAVYRSHCKLVTVNERLVHVTRVRCPKCSDFVGNCKRIIGDPEKMVLE